MRNEKETKKPGNPEIENLPLEDIIPDPNQPRKYFDEEKIKELADSIKSYGLLEPILVRPVENKFMIVHGERRYRAHKLIPGKTTITAIIRELTDEEAANIQLAENVQRDDLTDIELAWEFDRRVKKGQTHEQIAKVIGKDRSYVTQRLALLKLPAEDKERMLRGELSFSNARLLLSIKDPEMRERVSKQINKDTTVRELRQLIHPEEGTPQNVTHVTFSDGDAVITALEVWKTIWREDGTFRERVPVSELLSAYIKDLKVLRRLA